MRKYSMIFETLKSKNALWIKRKIGEMLHSLIASPSGPKMTVTEINALDRKAMAVNWYNETVDGYNAEKILNIINELYNHRPEEYVNDLAIYIDKRLVQTYIKAKEFLDVSPSQVQISLDENGNLPYDLKYKYSENYSNKTPIFVVRATERQIEYLEYLALKNGYYFNNNSDLTKEAASSYIDFLLNIDCLTEPAGFDVYFIKAI